MPSASLDLSCHGETRFSLEKVMKKKGFKRVPALDRCLSIMDLLAQSERPMGISEISNHLSLNKSTVFNMCHTLIDLNVLENHPSGKFALGTRFYILASRAGRQSTLIHLAHPYLEQINKKTNLSVFLGLRTDSQAILIDKVDAAQWIRVSSEIGMQMPKLAGAGIKAMLCQLPDKTIDEILDRTELKRYTPFSITDKKVYKEEILEARERGIAYDLGEYMEDMVGFAIPVRATREDVQASIWAAGLKSQVTESSLPFLKDLLVGISSEINSRLQ
jgi:DNA-binding IclR family transcriptional regulator